MRLPVYSGSLGDISIFHDVFFYFIIALTVIFVLMEKFQLSKGYKFKKVIRSLDKIIKTDQS